MSEHLKKFEEFCKANATMLNQADSLNKEIDLLDINENKQPRGQDLLDLEVSHT